MAHEYLLDAGRATSAVPFLAEELAEMLYFEVIAIEYSLDVFFTKQLLKTIVRIVGNVFL